MTTLVQPCVGPNGSTVTTANATSGNQWDSSPATTGTGTTKTYDNSVTPPHGNATSMLLHFAAVSSTAYTAWKASIPSPAANSYAWGYGYKTADPSVAGQRISHMMSGLGVAAGALQITTGGKLRIVNSSGTNAGTSTASIPNSALFRWEWEITGVSGATGVITARFYSGANLEGTTPDDTVTSGAGAAVTGLLNEVRYGCSTVIANSSSWDIRLSDLGWSDTAQRGPIGTATSSAFLMFC